MCGDLEFTFTEYDTAEDLAIAEHLTRWHNLKPDPMSPTVTMDTSGEVIIITATVPIPPDKPKQ